MKCPVCKSLMTYMGQYKTLVDIVSPPGHNHDDNCVRREYRCYQCNMRIEVSKRNRCPVLGCTWIGKAKCDCHVPNDKVDEWPE